MAKSCSSQSESDSYERRTKRKHDSICESESQSESVSDDEAESHSESVSDDGMESRSESDDEAKEEQGLITLEDNTEKTLQQLNNHKHLSTSNLQKLDKMANNCSSDAQNSPDQNIEISSNESLEHGAQKICESKSTSESQSQASDLKRKHQEIESVDVNEANNKQSRTIFQKKFSAKDDKKILKALLKTGYTSAAKAFWRRANDSLKLSIPVNQTQLYEKVRRLRDLYLKRLRSGNCGNLALSPQERRLHDLSDKIWGNDAKADLVDAIKIEAEDHEKNETKMNSDKLDKLLSKLRNNNYSCVDFPVAEALGIISGLKRSELEKKWKELQVSKIELYARTMKLINETMEAAKLSPSFL